MCNFYLMYYVEDDEPLEQKVRWEKFVGFFQNIFVKFLVRNEISTKPHFCPTITFKYQISLSSQYCFTAGPPYFYWKNPEVHLNHIPDDEASQL